MMADVTVRVRLVFQMDEFVLPPFESSCVLKDKDIVCEENVCAAIEVKERARILPDAVVLANEETGGDESEFEEEEVLPEKKTSKKRKGSSKSPSSK
ncbi:unnamed protein product [Eruca vesicaria subsp. sativa]|uniref:Uncharacterized protein n=1 Tax=Eruca vesicaria subsp. sativa TaxID=29727 RepID=A0ABC8JW75_ERUVS|nr:unnamed protein product [Eruca vesicaria subsp. sativa]